MVSICAPWPASTRRPTPRANRFCTVLTRGSNICGVVRCSRTPTGPPRRGLALSPNTRRGSGGSTPDSTAVDLVAVLATCHRPRRRGRPGRPRSTAGLGGSSTSCSADGPTVGRRRRVRPGLGADGAPAIPATAARRPCRRPLQLGESDPAGTGLAAARGLQAVRNTPAPGSRPGRTHIPLTGFGGGRTVLYPREGPATRNRVGSDRWRRWRGRRGDEHGRESRLTPAPPPRPAAPSRAPP